MASALWPPRTVNGVAGPPPDSSKVNAAAVLLVNVVRTEACSPTTFAGPSDQLKRRGWSTTWSMSRVNSAPSAASVRN